MMRLAGRGVVDPVDSAICQRCFHTNNSHKHGEAKIMGYGPHTTPLPVEGIVFF